MRRFFKLESVPERPRFVDRIGENAYAYFSSRCRPTCGRGYKIVGIPIDHSFLNYKKELLDYGFKVGKISLKEKTVAFSKGISS